MSGRWKKKDKNLLNKKINRRLNTWVMKEMSINNKHQISLLINDLFNCPYKNLHKNSCNNPYSKMLNNLTKRQPILLSINNNLKSKHTRCHHQNLTI